MKYIIFIHSVNIYFFNGLFLQLWQFGTGMNIYERFGDFPGGIPLKNRQQYLTESTTEKNLNASLLYGG